MTLVASAVWVTIIRAAGVGLQAVVFIALAHLLAVADMGVFVMVYAALGLVRALGSLGADQVVLRDVAAGTPSAMPPQECVGAALLMTGISSLCLMALLSVVFSLDVLPLTVEEVVAMVLGVPAFALTGVLAAYVRARGHNLAAQAPESIGQHLLFAILLSVWPFVLDRETALTILSLSGWAVLIIYCIICGYLPDSSIRKPSRSTLRGVLQEGGKVFLAMSATALSVRAPVWLAGLLVGTNAAAIFEMANRFGSLAGITTSSVGATFSPHFARWQTNERELDRSLRMSSLLAAAPAVLWLLTVSISAPYAVGQVLPSDYAPAAYPMAVIALAFTLNAGFGMSTNLFFMTGRTMTVVWLSFGQLAVVCLGACWLGQFWGVAGIAWAMVIGAFVRDGLCMMAWVAGCREAAA